MIMLLLFVLSLCWVADGLAEGAAGKRIGFSNLVFRIEGADQIGIASGEYRIQIVEWLRESRLNAVGAESLVFGKDHSAEAELLIGGTVKELNCRRTEVDGKGSCYLGVLWEVMDVETDRVIYRYFSRYAELYFKEGDDKAVARRLLKGSLQALIRRPRFVKLLKTEERKDNGYPAATFSRCSTKSVQMPAGAEDALSATVIVDVGNGHGSGFFVSEDGLVLTAAHVVANASEITVIRRDGLELPARLIRISRSSDAALLRVEKKSDHCLVAGGALPKAGEELYALGAPEDRHLGFSLTRGIVSGVRIVGETEFIQTDASINRGNSGGPLVNEKGWVDGIVSWKMIGGTVEGLAFAVPIGAAFKSLSISSGNVTSPLLDRGISLKRSFESDVFEDTADAIPELDPRRAQRMKREREREAKERQEEARREARRERIRKATPGYVKVMRWGGVGLAVAGATTGSLTFLLYQKDTTPKPEYQRLRLINDVAWIAAGVGAASFGVSWLLVPKDRGETTASNISLRGGFNELSLEVNY